MIGDQKISAGVDHTRTRIVLSEEQKIRNNYHRIKTKKGRTMVIKAPKTCKPDEINGMHKVISTAIRNGVRIYKKEKIKQATEENKKLNLPAQQ